MVSLGTRGERPGAFLEGQEQAQDAMFATASQHCAGAPEGETKAPKPERNKATSSQVPRSHRREILKNSEKAVTANEHCAKLHDKRSAHNTLTMDNLKIKLRKQFLL